MRLRHRSAPAAALPALALALAAALASCASSPSGARGSALGPEAARGPEAAASILLAAGMEAYPSSPIQRLSMDGIAWTERALELINGAEDYIFVASFLLTDHPNARAILEAMAAASGRGVRVNLIVDSSSYYRAYPMSSVPEPAIIMEARRLGIPVAEYNSIRGMRIFRLLGLLDRDHRKYWIVDGKVAVLGGQNVDWDSLRDAGEGGCVDAMVEFSSSGAIAELRDSFIRTWNSYSIDRLSPEDFPVRAAAPEAEAWLVDQGMGKGGRVTAMFDAMFAAAGSELVFVQCYTYATPGLIRRIQEATRRGVKVDFILSGGHISERAEKGSYYCIADLIKAGARVYLYESPGKSLLHYKMIMADGRMASIGSANYNFRSQALERDISAIFADEASLAAVKAHLDQLRPYLREVGPEEAAEYRGLPYLTYFLLMQVAG
jgi:cardiolipin synthase A/B